MIDHMLPKDLDDLYGPGAESADDELSDEAAVKMAEEVVGAPREEIARAIRQRQFACAGCGRVVVLDGTPRTRAFIWTDVKTGKRSKYCWDCDDKHIQGY